MRTCTPPVELSREQLQSFDLPNGRIGQSFSLPQRLPWLWPALTHIRRHSFWREASLIALRCGSSPSTSHRSLALVIQICRAASGEGCAQGIGRADHGVNAIQHRCVIARTARCRGGPTELLGFGKVEPGFRARCLDCFLRALIPGLPYRIV